MSCLSRSAVTGSALVFCASLVSACGDSKSTAPTCTGSLLFGQPSDKTGLGAVQCQPRCTCSGQEWVAPSYGEDDIKKALSWTLLDPPPALDSDPYAQAGATEQNADAVCAFVPDAAATGSYRLKTYASEAAAKADKVAVTHFGACGLCSPLADLVVYMRQNDLGGKVRQCGLDNMFAPPAQHLQCLQNLGFDYACAQIYYYNTLHTREACSAPCLSNLNAPYNLADGSLNACLACDEEKSGAVFKRVAGRTRRNTGIANAICRPCAEVQPLLHDYLGK
jgi:hypothetical protein